jgi:uncharacterized damage-inducible protein DinB
MKIELYRDLESYHAWAMGKVLEQCKSLDSNALAAILPLGPGSLLATLKHMAAAEQVWLDRWLLKPNPSMQDMPDSIVELESVFASLARDRTALLESDPNALSKSISYRNMKGESDEQKLGDLVLHVLNHGIHHRAQVVHFLKRQGKSFPGGLDYIFYRIARPTILLQADIAKGCRHWGLEVGETAVPYDAPDLESLVQYCRYGNWAMSRLFDQCCDMADETLDQDRGMGVGSIRKTLLHIYDAECFWQANWRTTGSPFPSTPPTTSIAELSKRWLEMSEKKLDYIYRLGQDQLGRSVTVDVGGGPMEYHLSESLLQLSVHGTLHRAQVTNMLRSTGKTPDGLDFVVWLRQSSRAIRD